MANFYGELIVRITSDTKGLTSGLQSAAAQTEAAGKKVGASSATMAQKMNRVGMGLQNMGRTMTQFFTLPVAAGFAVAGVAAFKFEDALMRIQNLTGTSAAQTKLWGEELIKLGEATGQTPIRLAESLYFIASSGFKGAEAMKVLNSAAKASAAGLGDVNTTADVLTSALNAYGHNAITAAEATDILMKTVEVGKADPAALAASLGRIMPVAAQLKVELGEVGGAIAGLTLGGLSSAEAVTALRGTMVALVAPAKMSMDEMKKLGLSYKGITKMIADEGLIPTLQLLYEKTDGNMLAMRRLIPNVRALNGVMSLLGPNYKKNLEVTKQVMNANGALDKAMKNTAEQTVQKLRVAWASLQGSFIKIGAIILPVVADLAESFADLAKSFNELSPSTKKAILGFLALGAVLGPMGMMFGSLLRGIALIGPALAGIGPAMGAFAGRMAGLNVTAAGLSATGMMGGLTSLSAIAAGIAAAVPVVAISAMIATAITTAIDAGMKQAKANATERAKTGDGYGWKDFWSEVKATVTGPGDWFYEFVGGNEIDTVNQTFWGTKKALDALTKAGGLAGMQVRYLKEDLGKLRANREILGDLRVEKTVAQMRKWRTAIMDNLKVSQKESEAILRTMFGPDIAFTQKQWQAMNNGIDGAVKKAADLREQIKRATAFRDLPLVMSLNKQLDAVEARIDRMQTKAQRQQFARKANTLAVPGVNDWVGAAASGTAGALKIPVPQWAGKMKFPKVEVGGAKVALQGMGKYLDQVTKTRKLTINAKINTVQDALKGMRTRLKEIGDKPTTAKLKAEKSMLEAGVKGAKGILKGLKEMKTDPKVTVDTSSVAGSVDYVNRMMASIADKYVKVYIDAQKPPDTAWGKLVTKPEVRLVGEAGPEVILPLTKPARMLSLMRQAGIAHLAQQPIAMRQAPMHPQPQQISSQPTHVHYHSHVAVPQGVIVDDTQRFAKRLSPWQEREMLTAQRRRERGESGL